MTGGRLDGTSGAGSRAFRAGPIVWIAAVGAVLVLVNATSRIMEASRRGDDLAAWQPFVWEASSVAAIVALAPFVREAVARIRIRSDRLAPALLGHAALTLPFSIVHVGLMVAVRKLAYGLAGGFYDFSHGNLPLEFLYEYRKDVVTYAVLAALFWLLQWRAEEAAAKTPAAPERIEIRDGATAAYLPPADIAWVEAAGNYVEFHTAAGVRLVRGTLTAWEAKLSPLGFVRVHRSRIVNRARIASLAPTPAGDLAITLDSGQEIAGSRRYRAALDAPSR